MEAWSQVVLGGRRGEVRKGVLTGIHRARGWLRLQQDLWASGLGLWVGGGAVPELEKPPRAVGNRCGRGRWHAWLWPCCVCNEIKKGQPIWEKN